MSTERFDTTTDDEREAAIEAAAMAIQRGELVVLPTDTVYGIAADAFDPDAVADLLDAKGRGREMPPPVLVSSATTVDALASDVPDYARALIEEFWPGPLTLVFRQQSSLMWDLGDTRGTVAVRMPDDELTREILERTGPLAVSSANTTGSPAATTAEEADEMLGERVAVTVDGGTSPVGESSTIVDATGPRGRVLRQGALSRARLDEALEPLATTLEPSLDELPDDKPAAGDAEPGTTPSLEKPPAGDDEPGDEPGAAPSLKKREDAG
ncbi:L-threonylcarbamoyladenylate synthase [Nocardioides marinquilinus]|uniref:L-threonylcarbamoyladenylate synthase n=1 Tax=Nocardioides marinquilinus TaxID=1210400 RepID=UPI003CD07347